MEKFSPKWLLLHWWQKTPENADLQMGIVESIFYFFKLDYKFDRVSSSLFCLVKNRDGYSTGTLRWTMLPVLGGPSLLLLIHMN